MRRSLLASLLATALCASSAHAITPYQQQQQQQLAKQMRKRAEDDQRQRQNNNNDLARRQLGSNRSDPAQRMNSASPFVSPKRAGYTFGDRALGVSGHTSITPPSSIYERLHTEPTSIKAQLASKPPRMGFITSMLFHQAKSIQEGRGFLGFILLRSARAMHTSMVDHMAANGMLPATKKGLEELEKANGEFNKNEDERAKTQFKAAGQRERNRERSREQMAERERSVFQSLKD